MRAAAASAARRWLRICTVDDVPFMEGRSVTVAGRVIALFNTAHGFVAVDGVCPHRGGPLADGIVANHCVTCPLHGWRFDLTDGRAIAGGEGQLATHEVVEREGDVFLALPDGDR
jgi:nitrite reductase (NADH) small subunit